MHNPATLLVLAGGGMWMTGCPEPSGLPDDDCGEVQAVFNTNCVDCHGDHALGGLDLRDVSKVVGVVTPPSNLPLIAAEDPEGSYLVHKLLGTHLDVGGGGLQMPAEPLDAQDIETVVTWIEDGAVCGDPPSPFDSLYDPNDLDQAELFQCDGAPSSSSGSLRRLDHLSFRRRTGHHFKHETTANPFEPPGSLQYSTYNQGVSIELSTLDIYFDVLSYAGTHWLGEKSSDRKAWPARFDDDLFCMYDDPMPDVACIDYFAEQYLQTAVLHEAPNPDEIERLATFAQDALDEEEESGESRDSTILHITSAAWLHTNALFEATFGEGEADADGRYRLSDWEAASLVAHMVSDQGPGAAGVYLYDNELSKDDSFTAYEGGHMPDLVDAAYDGTIQLPEVAAALLRTYAMGVDSDRTDEWIDYGYASLDERQRRSPEWMGDKLDRFFLEFFDVESFESGFQDTPNATSQFDGENSGGYDVALAGLRKYESWNEPDGLMLFTDAIARVVVSDEEVLRGLLTTRDFYLPATDIDNQTGEFSDRDYSYRLFDLHSPIVATQEQRWVTFPHDQRAGMLTHPVWLAAHGDAFEDGPSAIHRGKWVREKLFCETVPPLELVTVEAQLVHANALPRGRDHVEFLGNDPREQEVMEFAAALRARDRIEKSIASRTECMTCHQSMNELGYPFEIYNHAGLLRVDDHGLPPDGSATLTNLPDPALNGTYSDALELMDAMADSPYVKRCFIRQTFRFFAGRDETLADACVLSDMEAAYDDSGGSFVSLLETLATHDSSMYRTNEETP